VVTPVNVSTKKSNEKKVICEQSSAQAGLKLARMITPPWLEPALAHVSLMGAAALLIIIELVGKR